MIRYKQIFLFSLMLLLTVFVFCQNDSSPDYYFNSGANLYIEDKSDEAMNQVTTGLQLFPGNQELIKLKELLEKEKEQQEQQQKQQQEQEKNKEEQEKEQEQQQQQQDQQDKQEQEQQQQQQNQQGQQDQQQQQQAQPQQISKQDAARMLEALKNDENKTLEKVKLQQVPAKAKKTEKDW